MTPGFFATLGIPLRQGRDVSEADTREAPFVAVVSESFVRRHWPGQNPLGQRLQFGMGPDGEPFGDRTVVGVVGDVRVRGLERSSEPQVYLSYQQVADGWIIFYTPKDLVVRSSGRSPDAGARRAPHRRPGRPGAADLRRAHARRHRGRRHRAAPVQARVLGAFAAIALLLAGIGIHGLLAFAVSSRAQEIGVRMALGAQARDILTLVLRQGRRLAAAGVALGVALAYAAGRSLEALLAGISPRDATTFLAAGSVSLLMVMLGSLLPALRAVRVDPLTAIRTE